MKTLKRYYLPDWEIVFIESVEVFRKLVLILLAIFVLVVFVFHR